MFVRLSLEAPIQGLLTLTLGLWWTFLSQTLSRMRTLIYHAMKHICVVIKM